MVNSAKSGGRQEMRVAHFTIRRGLAGAGYPRAFRFHPERESGGYEIETTAGLGQRGDSWNRDPETLRNLLFPGY
jgi:hypothetical protein